jgi:type I restriction enzyme R subunit
MDVYEVFEEPVKFKEELEAAIQGGEQLGLTYDVLEAISDIKKLMKDDILIENWTVDWDKKGRPRPRCV